MNFGNILKRRDPLTSAFDSLETGMADLIDAEFQEPLVLDDEEAAGHAEQQASATTLPALTGQDGPDFERVTPHTQNRLAAIKVFDEAHQVAQQELGRLGQALAAVANAHHLSRDFLSDSFADIHRSNELEVLNQSLSADNRRLGERAEKLEKLRARYDELIDALKRRETKLLQDLDHLRVSQGAAKLEAVEARNMAAAAESAQAELHMALAARTSQAERLLRENEALREKNIHLALEFEAVQRKHADLRRKHDDLSTVHAHESARYAETSAKLSSEEKELARVQKQHDALEARLFEANQSLREVEMEADEQERRYQSELHAMRGEMQNLNGRLQTAAAERLQAGTDFATLKARLNDLEAEKHVADQKLAAAAADENAQRRQAHDLGGRDDAEPVDLPNPISAFQLKPKRSYDALYGARARAVEKRPAAANAAPQRDMGEPATKPS